MANGSDEIKKSKTNGSEASTVVYVVPIVGKMELLAEASIE
jgi:hypothetical protein